MNRKRSFILIIGSAVLGLLIVGAVIRHRSQEASVEADSVVSISEGLGGLRKSMPSSRSALSEAQMIQADQMAPGNAAPASPAAGSRSAVNDQEIAPEAAGQGLEGSRENALKREEANQRKVKFDAWAKISVDSPEETQQKITAAAVESQGFVQGLNRNSIVVRVPVAKVRDVFNKILSLGIVLDKWLRATDITDAFHDTELRISVNRMLIAKLKQYLTETKDNKVRLSLLREIEQLTQETIQLESQLRSMDHDAMFSTITVEVLPRKDMELTPIPEDIAAFTWIVNLNPMTSSLMSSRWTDDHLPDGFAATNQGTSAETAEGDTLRMSYVPNNPDGSLEFWTKALEHRLSQRYTVNRVENVGKFVDFSLMMPSSDAIRYHVMVAKSGEKLKLIEVTYLSPEQEAKYQGNLLLASAKWL